jgi:FkbM family methyltransferase
MNTNSIRKLVARALPFQIRKRIPLRIARHLYFNGVFEARMKGKKLVKLLHAGHQIENEIYWRGFEGCHEKKSMQVFAGIVENLDPKVVWDIGANSGTYGVLAKALKPDSEVIFFEPIPKAAELVKANLELNQFDAKIFEIALGDFDGKGEIFFPKGHDFATSVTVNQDTVPKGIESDAMIIQVQRLETLIAKHGLDSPDLVKLDVETYEYEVLEGWGSNFPAEAIFLIEILREDLAQKIVKYFPQDEYEFWNIDDRKANIRKVARLGKSDFYNFLIVPNSKSKSVERTLGSTR